MTTAENQSMVRSVLHRHSHAFRKGSASLIAAIVTFLIATGSAHAQVTYLWNNSSPNWSTNSSWTAPWGNQSSSSSVLDTAQFSNTGSGNTTVTLSSSRNVYLLEFLPTALAYTFNSSNGTNRELGINFGITNNSSQTQTFNLLVRNTATSGVVSAVAGSSLVFNGGVALTASATSKGVTFGGAGNIIVNSTITNGGNTTVNATASTITVTSTGSTTLSGNNTYGGLTTMNANGGTLTLSGDNSGAAGGVTLTAGTLNINNANALGTGNFTITGGTIGNASGSPITIASNNLQNWNGNFAYNGTSDLNLGTGAVTMSASRIVTVDAGNLIVGGAIGGGAFSITKNGLGTLTLLSSDSSYNGTLTISGGTLNVGVLNNKSVAGPLGISAGTSSKLVFNGGTLQYTGNNATSTDRGFRLTGNATFDASGNGSSATMSFASAGSPTVDAGNKTFTLTGSNTGNNLMTATITDNATDSITSFVKNGVGTWVLGSASSSYTGTTTINSGTLSIASLGNGGVASSIGAASNAPANLVLGGGALLYTGATTSTDRNFTLTDGTTSQINVSNSTTILTMSGSSASTTGGLTKGSAGTLVLSGNNTYTGATTISAGTLQISSAGQLGSGTYAANIANNGTFSLNSTAGQTLSGRISGSGALVKDNTSILTLSGNNTYSGTTTLNAGTLNLNNANAIGTGVLTIAGGTIDNTGGAPIALATNNAQNWNGNFGFTGTNDLNLGTGAVTMSATRTVTVNAGNLTIGGDISGAGFGLTKAGNGTLLLGGSNTYTGTTTISAGTLQVATPSALVSSSTLQTASSTSFPSALKLASAGNYTMNSLDLKGFLLVNGPDSGNAKLTFTNGGVITSSAASRKIQAASGATISFDGSQFDIATYSSTTSRTLTLDGAGNIVFNAVLTNGSNGTNSGAISKTGNGILTLNAANTYTGNTSISAGTLLINGSTHSSSAVDVTGATLGGTGTVGGSVTVGSGATIAGGLNGVGTLNLSSSMTLNGNSTFSADISGATPGTEYNRLQLSGAAVTLNGVNNLALNLTYTPTDQQLFFLIVGASSITGRFDSLNGVTTTLNQNSTFTLGGQEFMIGYSGNSTAGTFSGGNDLVLQASAVPEPSTWALMVLGLAGAVVLIRRKKSPVLR